MEVKIRRIRLGLTQDQVCEMTGIGRSTISKIENGEIDGVRLGLLKKIAEVLQADFKELFLA